MPDKYFEKALNNFISDFAEGDAIRKFADRGYSVREIMENLSFPLPKEKVAEIVWKHYVDTGVICLDKPEGNIAKRKVSYVREYDKYGRSSFRQVVEETQGDSREYVECDFGLRKYQKPDEYNKWLNSLDTKDRDYIEGLPWPVGKVYHVNDERISRILD